MKKIFVFSCCLAAMLLMISCSGGSTTGDNIYTYPTETDEDSADSGSTDTGTTEPSDTGTTEPTDTGTTEPTDTGTTEPTDTGEPDTAPDEGDPQPDGSDTEADDGDSTPDGGDTEPDNDYPQNPCDPNPCNIPNSTGICNPLTGTQYACECSSGYYWHNTTDECKTESLTLGNICTGQNKCYNNKEEITCPTSSSEDFFGQDHWYASLGKCTPQSFTVQTISDQNVVLDNNTGLMWQQTIPTDQYKWADAVSYCNDLSYAGYSDWRLPTPQEHLTIIDNSRYYPAIDITYFPNTPSDYFWSSSTYVYSKSNAWYVYFDNGLVSYNSKTKRNASVRCVRGESLPNSTFNSTTVNGDVIVTDTKTGLMWQKTYETDKKNWQQALDYCENLTYAGYSDWRLPDKNELASLVNYEKYNPASDFPDMQSQGQYYFYFWSSSTSFITSFARYVDFEGGIVSGQNKPNAYFVRCVR